MKSVYRKRFVIISERDQFFQLTKKQAKNIKLIGFENIEIDEKVCSHWYGIFNSHTFQDLYFDHCKFLNDDFCVLDHLRATRLAITNCDIKEENVVEVSRIDLYYINYLDLSHNKLSTNEELLYQTLMNGICAFGGVGVVDLRNNGLSPRFKSLTAPGTTFLLD
jgi:hypothetical protein